MHRPRELNARRLREDLLDLELALLAEGHRNARVHIIDLRRAQRDRLVIVLHADLAVLLDDTVLDIPQLLLRRVLGRRHLEAVDLDAPLVLEGVLALEPLEVLLESGLELLLIVQG